MIPDGVEALGELIDEAPVDAAVEGGEEFEGVAAGHGRHQGPLLVVHPAAGQRPDR